MNHGLLPALAGRFSLYSLMAIGGISTLLPEMHRQLVVDRHWLSNADFTSLYAIAQAAPGPNMLFATLLGWKMAGLAGALVATAGICLPSSALAYAVAHLRERFAASRWRRILERALAPVTIGLTLGSGYLLLRAADVDGRQWALSAAVALLALRSRMNPLWLLAAGALLGAAGWL